MTYGKFYFTLLLTFFLFNFSSKHEEKRILTYLTHDKYNDGIAYNDVALALVSGVKFTKRIYPICLPNTPVVYQDHLKNNFVEILGFAIENESEFYCPIAFANNK